MCAFASASVSSILARSEGLRDAPMRLRVTAAAAALLTGCSTMSDTGGDSAEPGVAVYSGDSDGGGVASEDAARAQGDPLPSPRVAGDTQYQVREASLGIKVESIGDASRARNSTPRSTS